MVMYNNSAEVNETPGLEEYLKAIQARKLLVLLAALIGLGLAYLYTNSRVANYSASSRVLVAPSPIRAPNPESPPAPNLETEREVLKSESLADEVVRAVAGVDNARQVLGELKVQFRNTSTVLTLTYTHEDPVVAAAVVNGFASSYTAQRVDQTNDIYQGQLSSVDDAIATITDQVAAIDSQLVSVEGKLNRADPTDLATGEILRADRNRISNERSQLTSELLRQNSGRSALLQKQRGRSIAAKVLELADPPSSPNGFGERILWAIGLIFGVTAGVVVAFIADRLDTTAREESDVELAVGGSVLGSVPPFGYGNRDGASSLVMLSENRSTRIQRAQESFRRLRTSIQYLSNSSNIASFMFTSSRPAEGKSTISSNLAVALAQSGKSTILVSADMRRPTIETTFGIRNESGLSNYLGHTGEEFPPVISIGITNLAFIPSGPLPPNPGELLESQRFRELIVQLEATYDFVIVDTPPVLSAADAAAAATSVGGVVVVVDSRRTDTQTLLQVRSDLERAGARIVGSLLNKDRKKSTRFWSRRDRYAYERVSAQVHSS